MISAERSHELLRAYVATRCGTAFRELVEGWTGMVHSTALRVVRNQATLAEDITQTVFSRLAAAPEKVHDPRVLGAWLHAAATGCALDALRLEVRRRRREQTAQQLTMPTPEPTAPEAGDGRHELAAEIDHALGQLPPQDSQLLLMRFWQQQDWRSIGRNFGLSDDAAQKRMNRALERLRRILTRRGITSTVGVLSAVLAGTVPRELPAATVLKIISAAQVAALPGVTSTVLTSTVMTTKTKVAIAAAALIVAAIAPMVYQQHRIAALQGEIQAIKQLAFVHGLKKPSVAVLAKDRGSASGISDQLPEVSNLPAAGLLSSASPLMDQAASMDYDDLFRREVNEKLAALRRRLSLSPEQETKIAQALEYGQPKTKVLDNETKVVRATVDDKKRMEEAIIASLTATQQKEYEFFRAGQSANAMEAVANRELSSLQSMTTLSSEQKDQAFTAFSDIASKESLQDLPEPGGDPAAMKEAVAARWADRQAALAAILTPEQMAIYQQAGNPFTGGSGG